MAGLFVKGISNVLRFRIIGCSHSFDNESVVVSVQRLLFKGLKYLFITEDFDIDCVIKNVLITLIRVSYVR